MARRNPRPSTEILGLARLDETYGLPSWMDMTRGAGAWSVETAPLADGTTCIELGTAEDTARAHYFSAAGRRLTMVEPTRTNVIADANFVDANANNIPDNWQNANGAAGTDYTCVSGGPHGGVVLRLANTAAARGVLHTAITWAPDTQYSWSAYLHGTTIGAGKLFYVHNHKGDTTITLPSGTYDWTRVTETSTSSGGPGTTAYLETLEAALGGVLKLVLPSSEAGAYASTFAAGTRAAELLAIDASRVSGPRGRVSFLWCPMWANDNSTAVATLFTWGVGWRLDYDGSDDKFKVAVNGTYRAESAAQTFAAGSLHRLTVEYNAAGHALTVDGVRTTDATAWGTPTVAPYLGSRAASANCESAGYGDLYLAAA